MKVHEISVISVLMKSHQNKAEKPTMKQSIKVLNIKVMADIIKQDGKTIRNTQFVLSIANQTHYKFNPSVYDQ